MLWGSLSNLVHLQKNDFFGDVPNFTRSVCVKASCVVQKPKKVVDKKRKVPTKSRDVAQKIGDGKKRRKTNNAEKVISEP